MDFLKKIGNVNMAIEPLLTVKEVAEIFKVKPNTIWGWVKKGIIKTVPVTDGCTRFHPDEVRRLMGELL